MRIFITGSNGFVGSRLMWELESLGHEVHGIDLRTHCMIEKHPGTRRGDIRKIADLRGFDGIGFDLVIHCAAAKHDHGITRSEYYSHNQEGTRVLMQWCSEQNIPKVLYYCTVGVYGHPQAPCDETGKPAPNHPYGASKYAGEKLVMEWRNQDTARQVVVLRPAIIYGPHNFANMYNLIHMLHRRPYLTIGSGGHVKGMVSLSNLIDMTLFAMNRFGPEPVIYNCTDKPYITLHQLMRIIAAQPGFHMPYVSIPEWAAVGIGKGFDILGRIMKRDLPINSDRMHKLATATHFLSEKIRQDGYVQQHSVMEEIRRTTDWYLEYNGERVKGR
jgi:nucleoside-diphosphate-sugar epimerase